MTDTTVTPSAATPPDPLAPLSIEELHARRDQLAEELKKFPGGIDDPSCPFDLLRDLAFCTQALRRRNAGPPRKTAPTGAKKKLSSSDLLDLL